MKDYSNRRFAFWDNYPTKPYQVPFGHDEVISVAVGTEKLPRVWTRRRSTQVLLPEKIVTLEDGLNILPEICKIEQDMKNQVDIAIQNYQDKANDILESVRNVKPEECYNPKVIYWREYFPSEMCSIGIEILDVCCVEDISENGFVDTGSNWVKPVAYCDDRPFDTSMWLRLHTLENKLDETLLQIREQTYERIRACFSELPDADFVKE